ncbi:MAG TPA: tRNA 4-thiouridine(8) synthase ThiI [Candidatus Omnitrophota bacterium]|nr:tRNA 4-thiouridine(8) synthase ThiI [Candidatus Omnitrophota bacterium]HPT38765.1 tRNA 4-thiouridine(8) synthase ThiI [Candidatus Omnitrophota bacterium]
MSVKAIALISGGLDSLLAAKLICDQGCEVVGLHFKIPFCKINIKKSFPDIGIKIIEVDLGQEFLKLIQAPHYGFGSNMNPCIDCKILMFSKARELMPELGAQFIITGEVLGQRPMSQTKQALKLIKYRSGLEDLLLRPLSAQFFPPSLAEKEGWVKREKLLNFNGRLRTPQMQLAHDLGLNNYATPAGGCLLTDPGFSKRLVELLEHQELSLENLELLKIGRHFRLGSATRLVVGRNEGENNQLAGLACPGDYLFSPPQDLAGPTCLARGVINPELIALASQITSAYTDVRGLEKIEVLYRQVPQIRNCAHPVAHLPKERFKHLFI